MPESAVIQKLTGQSEEVARAVLPSLLRAQ